MSSAPESGASMTNTGMYNWRVAAVYNALEQRGKREGPLTVDDLISLGHLDQYHYYGVDACNHAAAVLGLDKTSKVLDIGSGIGGPARYLSLTTGCDVTGVEMQEALVTAAQDLTSRVGLAERVRFVVGDFVSAQDAGHAYLTKGSFDHFMSQLVFLHIPGRASLLKSCFESLKPGGTFLIEDFALIGKQFTEEEDTQLKSVVSAVTVTSSDQYIADLESAGFVDVQAVDMSVGWTKWGRARYEEYVANRETTVAMHGEALFNERSAFYKVIADLFSGGNLGGVCLTGRKPSVLEGKLLKGRQLSHRSEGAAVLNEYGNKV